MVKKIQQKNLALKSRSINFNSVKINFLTFKCTCNFAVINCKVQSVEYFIHVCKYIEHILLMYNISTYAKYIKCIYMKGDKFAK